GKERRDRDRQKTGDPEKDRRTEKNQGAVTVGGEPFRRGEPEKDRHHDNKPRQHLVAGGPVDHDLPERPRIDLERLVEGYLIRHNAAESRESSACLTRR